MEKRESYSERLYEEALEMNRQYDLQKNQERINRNSDIAAIGHKAALGNMPNNYRRPIGDPVADEETARLAFRVSLGNISHDDPLEEPFGN